MRQLRRCSSPRSHRQEGRRCDVNPISHPRGQTFSTNNKMGRASGSPSPVVRQTLAPWVYSRNPAGQSRRGFRRSALWSSAGFPDGAGGKEPACQCKRHKKWRFNPWVGKLPWRRKRHPTPVLLPGESHGQRSPVGRRPRGRKESDTTEQRGTAHVTASHCRVGFCCT